MNKKIIIKTYLLSVILLGLTVAARAADPLQSKPVPLMGSMGLLGQTYASLAYSYHNLEDTSAHADGFGFALNQSLGAGLDGLLTYDWTRSGQMAGSHLSQQTLGGALRAFTRINAQFKPYFEAGAGYAWAKFAGENDNSFVWDMAVGAELQVAPAVVITPYIKYQQAPDLTGGSVWNFGVQANYWVDSQWAVTVGLNLDDSQNSSFTVGTNFRF